MTTRTDADRMDELRALAAARAAGRQAGRQPGRQAAQPAQDQYTPEQHHQAQQARLRQLRERGIPLPAGQTIDRPDPLDAIADPGAFLQALDDEAADEELAEIIRLGAITDEELDRRDGIVRNADGRRIN